MEQAILLYLLKSVLYASVLTGYYWFGLRNQVFHPYNRFYLLAVVLVSLLLPFVHWQWTAPAQALPAWYVTSQRVPLETSTLAEAADDYAWMTNPWIWIGMLAAAISLFRLSRLTLGWIVIYRYSKRYPGVPMQDFIWHNTSLPAAPFSFFSRLFWRQDIAMDSEPGARMLTHELTHIRERHSWDQLFIQLALVVGWFNPFFWIIRQELRAIHEFLADRKAVQQGDAAALAQVLLATIPTQPFLTHHFSQSPIKRRIMMIAKHPQTKLGYWSRLAAFPTLGICFLALSASTEQKPLIPNSAPPTTELSLVDTTKPTTHLRYQGEKVKSITVNPGEKKPSRMVHVITTSGKEYWLSVDQAKAAGILPPPPPPPPVPVAPSGGKMPPPPPVPAAPLAPTVPAVAENDLPHPTEQTIQIQARRVQSEQAADGSQTVTMSGPINIEVPKDAAITKTNQPALYVIDGKQVTVNEVKQLSPEQISLVQILKGKSATDKYGAQAEAGVVEITTKQ